MTTPLSAEKTRGVFAWLFGKPRWGSVVTAVRRPRKPRKPRDIWWGIVRDIGEPSFLLLRATVVKNGREARELSAWLLRAADWLEDQHKRGKK